MQIEVDPKMMPVAATVLHPPAIVYDQSERTCVEPRQDGFLDWKIQRLYKPAESVRKWFVVVFQRELNQRDCE